MIRLHALAAHIRQHLLRELRLPALREAVQEDGPGDDIWCGLRNRAGVGQGFLHVFDHLRGLQERTLGTREALEEDIGKMRRRGAVS